MSEDKYPNARPIDEVREMLNKIPGNLSDYKMAEGWICPKCKAVMAPNMPTCWYCKPETFNANVSQPYQPAPQREKEG